MDSGSPGCKTPGFPPFVGEAEKKSGGMKPGNKSGNLNQKKTRKNKRGQGKES